MQTLAETDLKKLYELDANLWLEKIIELLKQKRFDDLDLVNLIEELESLGRRDKTKVESLLRQIIIHLLLLQYWTQEYEYNAKHWRGEIATFRIQLNRQLTTNLHKHLLDNLEEIYQEAVFIVSQRTEINTKQFPPQCDSKLEQLLDKNWLPINN